MKKPCNYPGCPALLDRGTYCPAHKASQPKRHTLYDRQIRDRDLALAMAARIRSSPRWQRVRKQVLADHPICQDPHGDHARQAVTRTATQVHHIQPLGTHPEMAYVADNLLAVCTACHARLEREARSSQPEQRPASPVPTSKQWSPFG